MLLLLLELFADTVTKTVWKRLRLLESANTNHTQFSFAFQGRGANMIRDAIALKLVADQLRIWDTILCRSRPVDPKTSIGMGMKLYGCVLHT